MPSAFVVQECGLFKQRSFATSRQSIHLAAIAQGAGICYFARRRKCDSPGGCAGVGLWFLQGKLAGTIRKNSTYAQRCDEIADKGARPNVAFHAAWFLFGRRAQGQSASSPDSRPAIDGS